MPNGDFFPLHYLLSWDPAAGAEPKLFKMLLLTVTGLKGFSCLQYLVDFQRFSVCPSNFLASSSVLVHSERHPLPPALRLAPIPLSSKVLSAMLSTTSTTQAADVRRNALVTKVARGFALLYQ